MSRRRRRRTCPLVSYIRSFDGRADQAQFFLARLDICCDILCLGLFSYLTITSHDSHTCLSSSCYDRIYASLLPIRQSSGK
jgi:hypothetical protein